MATEAWDATYETTPTNTDKRHLGDDEFRDTKRNIRETLQQGGHYDPNAISRGTATENTRGRHVVDGGGAGLGPDIYQSDASTKLVGYADTQVTCMANLLVKGTAGLGALDSSARLNTAGSPYTMDPTSDTSSVYSVDTSSGNVQINLPDQATENQTYIFNKTSYQNRLILQVSNGSIHVGRDIITGGTVTTTTDQFAEGWRGTVIVTAVPDPSAPGTDVYWSVVHTPHMRASKAANFTLDDGCEWYMVDTTGGTVTITLPAAATSYTGFGWLIWKPVATNRFTFAPNSAADNINGGAGGASADKLIGSQGFAYVELSPVSSTEWKIHAW